MESQLVYIVMLNYNGSKLTIESVKSFNKIKYSNYRILIVDNNSTDDSFNVLNEKLKQYKKCTLIKLHENLGYSGGNNVGIKKALENNADYILIANNDIIVEENFLGYLVNSLNIDKKIAVVTPKIYYFGSNIINSFGAYKSLLGKIKNIGIHKKDNEKYEKDIYVKYVMGCCVMFRASIFHEVGTFDERFFMYLEESDLFERINKKYKLQVVAGSKIWHKEFSSSNKNNTSGKVNYFCTYYIRRNSLLYADKNYGYKGLVAKLYYMAVDLCKIFLHFKDKQLRKVIKLAWSDYFKSNYFRSNVIQKLIE